MLPPPPPPTHHDALTSSSSQSLRAWYWNRGRPPAPPRSLGATACACGPRGFGPASSSGPWPPRRRLASGGAGKEREVLILPVNLWYSEAMGRRALAHWLGCFVKKFPFSLSLFPLPTPSSRKARRGKRRRWGKKKGEPGRSAPHASRIAWVLSDSAWLSFSAPSPAAQKPRVGVIAFSFCFFFFFFKSSPWPCSASLKRKARYQKHTKGGDMSRPHYLAPTRYQLLFSSPPGPLQLLLFLLSRVASSRCSGGTREAPVPGRLLLMSVGLWMGVQGWGTHRWTGGRVSQRERTALQEARAEQRNLNCLGAPGLPDRGSHSI